MDDWRKIGNPKSIYATDLGITLSLGDLHSGTTFDANIEFSDPYIEQDILKALKDNGAYPVFSLIITPSHE